MLFIIIPELGFSGPVFAAHLWDFSSPSSILLVPRAEKVIIWAARRGRRAELTGGGHAISPQLPDIQQLEATTLGVLPEEGRLLRHLGGQKQNMKNGSLKGAQKNQSLFYYI